MIFLTVGTQLPFDRLVGAVDDWAGVTGRPVFAQIGASDMQPQHLEWTQLVSPSEFRNRMQSATLIISHAGMGSILTALEFDKPILVMPRRAAFREMRNDHQVATAGWLATQGKVAVAMDEAQLAKRLESIDQLAAPGQIQRWASEPLLDTLRGFINAR